MITLNDLFEKAKKKGIRRSDIGRYLYGKNYLIIYNIKNPTVKTMEKIENAIKNIKKINK